MEFMPNICHPHGGERQDHLLQFATNENIHSKNLDIGVCRAHRCRHIPFAAPYGAPPPNAREATAAPDAAHATQRGGGAGIRDWNLVKNLVIGLVINLVKELSKMSSSPDEVPDQN